MRLGDDIDDHCSRCKRTMTHSIVAMVGEEVSRVRCRTCSNEHAYRKNRTGKKEMTKEEAFAKVLASVTGQLSGQPEAPKRGKKK